MARGEIVCFGCLANLKKGPDCFILCDRYYCGRCRNKKLKARRKWTSLFAIAPFAELGNHPGR